MQTQLWVSVTQLLCSRQNVPWFSKFTCALLLSPANCYFHRHDIAQPLAICEILNLFIVQAAVFMYKRQT